MEEKLEFLIKYLIVENKNNNIEMPFTFDEKEKIWRALCNIRKPNPISDEYLKVQDEYLQKRLNTIKIVDSNDLPTINKVFLNNKFKNGNKMVLWQGNITRIKADCIVNAANSTGLGCFQPGHDCIDNQVQTYSGIQMRLECNSYMKSANYEFGLPTGEAFITKGYNLPVKYVIHTVGPIINFNVTDEHKKLLENCYINSLKLAVNNNIKTIVFPCISTGIFSFPRKLAVKCAVQAVSEFLESNTSIEKVIFCCFGDENYEIYQNYFEEEV